MKLGDDTIVLVTRTGTGTYDDRGNELETETFTEVPWCLVTPSFSSEPDERTTPTIRGLQVYAPPGTGMDAADAVIWPATATGDPQTPWAGPRYEVYGDAGVWEESEQAQLRKVT